ncbi:MAG: flagellar hook-associated protein FlgL [Herminiimonas sp.]|nr:flagellar hook-associated protein FlgL [Herminiimonas sp.]
MRLSTNTIFAANVSRLNEIQTGIVRTQQQISTGRRILTPADDPIGAAQVLDLTQGQSINTQFATNRQSTANSLSAEEQVLQGTTSLLQDVKTLVISAGNGAFSDSERKYLATDLTNRLAELRGQANSTDGTGNYLFAGFKVTTEPFTQSATGITYNGDQGQRFGQVGTSRQIAVSDTGDAVFEKIRSQGVYTTAAAPANVGGASVSALGLSDPKLLKPNDYDIKFAVSAGVTTYSILDKTAGTTLSAGNPYASNVPIVFDGRTLTVTNGATGPANGDVFTVREDRNQSIFKTLGDLITALQTPTGTPQAKAELDQSLSIANGNIDHALDNVLTVRASIGSRLKELDAMDSAGADRDFQYAQALQQVQDVDYNKAISDFTQQNTALEAAQKTFVKVSSMSLFSLL